MKYTGDYSHTENYSSALENKVKVEKQLLTEIENGRIKIVTSKPKIINAIGAIIKKDSNKEKTRIIMDCSAPANNSFNDLATDTSVGYDDVRVVRENIKHGDFMCKVDASNAFRVINVAPEEQDLLGLKWTFSGNSEPTYMVDCCMSFGVAKGPQTYQKISKAATRIMKKAGYNRVYAYLDDWIILESTFSKCLEAQSYLVTLLRRLGISINYSKIEGPTRKITFLGVEIDTNSYTLSIPQEKLDSLKLKLINVRGHKSVSKKTLEALTGLLCWIAQVTPWGNQYLRYIYDRCNKMSKRHHKTRITKEIKEELDWWMEAANKFICVVPIKSQRSSFVSVASDATLESLGAVVYDSIKSLWFYSDYKSWPLDVQDLPITYKEVLAVFPVFLTHAPSWRGKLIHLHMDNKPGVSILNKGTCKNLVVMRYLKIIGILCKQFDIIFKAFFYSGKDNFISDALSRIHLPGGVPRWKNVLLSLRGATGDLPAGDKDPCWLDNVIHGFGGHRICL